MHSVGETASLVFSIFFTQCKNFIFFSGRAERRWSHTRETLRELGTHFSSYLISFLNFVKFLLKNLRFLRLLLSIRKRLLETE